MTRKKNTFKSFLDSTLRASRLHQKIIFFSLGKGLLTQQTKELNHILANISTTVFTRSAYQIFWEVDAWHMVCTESESHWSCEAYKR